MEIMTYYSGLSKQYVKYLTLLSFFLLNAALSAAPPGISDRYIGILRHEKLKREQLAKIDFILSREENNTTIIKAVLTLHFGDFKSGEYIAYSFEDVKYNVMEKAFVFTEKEHGVTLIAREFSPLELKGELTSVHGSDSSTLLLRSDKPVAPTLPLLEPVWGEYRGKCLSTFSPGKKVDTVVQLYTYRSSVENTEVSNNPFRAYNIKGFIGEQTENGCFLHSTKKMCLVANVDAGTYNFFENQLNIYCNVRDMRCIPEKDGLSCERCEFLKRVSPTPPLELTPPQAKSASLPPKAPIVPGEGSSLGGLYRGYLHHEYLDVYQPAQLNVTTYQSGSKEEPKLNIAAAATLYFGDFGSAEALPYHFAERSYPLPLSILQFVFNSPDPASNIDPILQVNTIGDGNVKGVWFSRLFGRVGTFELYKNGLPELPANAKKMELVSGNYDGNGDWQFDLLIKKNSVQPTTLNPFGSLTFAGYQFFRGNGKRERISGGSYDFYTGRISFEATDESGERTHIGQRLSRKKMLINTMMRGVLTPILPFELQPFKLVGSRN